MRKVFLKAIEIASTAVELIGFVLFCFVSVAAEMFGALVFVGGKIQEAICGKEDEK